MESTKRGAAFMRHLEGPNLTVCFRTWAQQKEMKHGVSFLLRVYVSYNLTGFY